MKSVVLGSGAWGTALALLLLRNGHSVTLWDHNAEKAARMNRKHKNSRLPGVTLPAALRCSGELGEAAQAELAVFAVPSYAMRETARQLRGVLRPGALLISAAKGVESGSCLRMTQLIRQELGEGFPLVALSGPSHAEEVALALPTGCISASEDEAAARRVQEALMCKSFRVYTNPDPVGVELCGAVKNIVALGCGISDGLGYGDNAMALLLTRAMTEAGALVERAGGLRQTCAGLAGMGDLIVTCTSRHSRNRQAGLLLGQGLSVREALEGVGAVVEGYYAAASIHELAARLHVPMPICGSIHSILYGGVAPQTVMQLLMCRDARQEF